MRRAQAEAEAEEGRLRRLSFAICKALRTFLAICSRTFMRIRHSITHNQALADTKIIIETGPGPGSSFRIERPLPGSNLPLAASHFSLVISMKP